MEASSAHVWDHFNLFWPPWYQSLCIYVYKTHTSDKGLPPINIKHQAQWKIVFFGTHPFSHLLKLLTIKPISKNAIQRFPVFPLSASKILNAVDKNQNLPVIVKLCANRRYNFFFIYPNYSPTDTSFQGWINFNDRKNTRINMQQEFHLNSNS